MKILLSVFLLAMGAVLLIGALEKKRKLQDPHLRYAEAVITDIIVTPMGNRNTQHTVRVEYEMDGTVRRAKLDTYTAGMHVGDSVAILADPEEPETVTLASSAAPLIMLIVGCVCIALAVVTYLK